MKQLSIRFGLIISSLAGATLIAVVPVAAQQSADDAGSTSNNTAGSTSGTGNIHGGNLNVSTTTASGTDDANNANGGLHAKAMQLLSQARQNNKQHTQAQRQKVCEQRQVNINDRFATLGTRAQKYLDGFNAIFTKVQAFQTKNQLNVSNYSALVADVTAKQATATTDVGSLSALKGTTIDCTSSDPAATVATIKTATDSARSSLQAYRGSLKTLVEALLQAKTSASANTSTGGN